MVDSTTGFSINGVPIGTYIQQGTNSGILTNLFVTQPFIYVFIITNAAGVASNYNGLYYPLMSNFTNNTAWWTNSTSGWSWYYTNNIAYLATNPAYLSGPLVYTNNSNAGYGAFQRAYSAGTPTNQPFAYGNFWTALPLLGVISTNGIQTLISNTVGPAAVTIGASPFTWTNPYSVNIQLSWAGGVTNFSVNGSSWFAPYVVLQPGEWATWAYTSAPSASWKPF